MGERSQGTTSARGPSGSAFADFHESFAGPVEVDEAYFGAKRKIGCGPKGKTAVVAAKDRETKPVVARVADRTDGAYNSKKGERSMEALIADLLAAGIRNGATYWSMKR